MDSTETHSSVNSSPLFLVVKHILRRLRFRLQSRWLSARWLFMDGKCCQIIVRLLNYLLKPPLIEWVSLPLSFQPFVSWVSKRRKNNHGLTKSITIKWGMLKSRGDAGRGRNSNLVKWFYVVVALSKARLRRA